MREMLMDLIYIILTGIGVAVVKVFINYINKKIDEAQKNTEILEYEKLQKYIDAAQEVISNAVLTVSQTYVDSLKNSGSFDMTAQAEAKNKAIEIAKTLITEESKQAIITVYNDFEEYLDNMIESLVKQNKIIEKAN